MSLEYPKATRRISHTGHGSYFDIIFSICAISKNGIVSSTVSDHEMVYAVIGLDSIKQNAKIRDYRKIKNPETSVGAVLYLQNSLQNTV